MTKITKLSELFAALEAEERVIALRSAVRSIANADSGDLAKFIGVSSLKSFIDKDLILAELVDFSIPGTQFVGRGMTTEHFELICRGYVQALYQGEKLTDRQREIAIKCAELSDLRKALAEHGMVAVPVEPDHGVVRQMEIEHQNCESYYMPDHMTAAYKAMIQAAQEEE